MSRKLHQQQLLLEAISRAQSQFISSTDAKAAFDGLLSDLLALTGSEYGFIGEVLFTGAGQPYLRTEAITNIAWDEATRAFFAEHAPQGMEFRNLKTLFGAVLASGEVVIANQPGHDPRRGGLPEGHPPLNAFLGVPIRVDNKLVAMVGVADRRGGYDQSVIAFLQPLLATIGQLVEARRSLTERKRAEEALRQSEILNRSLVEHLPQRMFVKDRTSAYLFCNSNYARDLGIGPEQIVGKDDFAFFPRELAEGYRADDREVMAGGKIKDVDERYRTAGEERWVHTIKAPYRDEQGQVIGVLGLFEDITERRRAEESLQHREAELRESQRIARIGSWEWMIATGVITWSEGLNLLLGRDRGAPAPTFEVLASCYAPESWERLGAAIARTIETGSPYELELEMIRADGARCWTTTRGEAIRGADGTVVRLRGTVHDITERRRAEDALRLQSAALNATVIPIFITDRDGTIEWINAAFTVMTGYGSEEVLGKNPRDLVRSGVHDQAFYQHLWDTLLAGKVWRGEMTNRRKDGRLYPEVQTITPVKDARGEISHFIAVKRDLTAQRQLEAQVLQAQKMETVGRLAGGIAHDFNNLLTVINGTADLALADLAVGAPLRTDFEDIRQAGERGALLTRQLLAFSRKQIMTFEALSVSTLVADLQGMLQRLIGEHIALVVAPAREVGRVMADPTQIAQVVLNLAVNARDAMPDGGTLTVETRDVTLDAADAAVPPSVPPGPYVMLAVSDTGVGMDAATCARIFEPFFTTKEAGRGTGLGLSTVYGIVEQSGGRIRVHSAQGQGTTFEICLPRVEEAVHLSPPAPPVRSGHGTETILLVEDEEAVCRLAQRVLQAAGYTVLRAASGEEALRVLERHDGPVHLILTDVVLPGISGRDLADRLADLRPRVKVLYTSGYTDDAILRHGVLDHATAFVGKPYTAAELTRKVREVLDRQE